MAKAKKSKKAPYIKKKEDNKLGYRTSDFFKSKKFSGSQKGKIGSFNPSGFKIQHKG